MRTFHVTTKVKVGGVLLAFCAGMVNIIAFKILSTFVSHHTGNLSMIGLNTEASEVNHAMNSGLLLLSFLSGSLVCGFLIGNDTSHRGLALYDFCLLGVATLLVATTVLADQTVARYLAAGACGLQNGMATSWSGAIVRTTHVTGLLTDVGLLLGRIIFSTMMRKLCGKHLNDLDKVELADDISKLSILSSLCIAFLLGAFFGGYLEQAMGAKAFLFPAAIAGIMGVSYSVYRVSNHHQWLFSDAENEVVDVPEDVPAGNS
jgi:uncharacterized membrane protein YoaK (UPF0700 family)